MTDEDGTATRTQHSHGGGGGGNYLGSSRRRRNNILKAPLYATILQDRSRSTQTSRSKNITKTRSKTTQTHLRASCTLFQAKTLLELKPEMLLENVNTKTT